MLAPEGRQVFPRLSVCGNMRRGATTRRDFDSAEINAMLDRLPRLRPPQERPTGLLPNGGQQMLAFARGLSARADLLLDKSLPGPAAAVAQKKALSPLRDEEATMLLVDQIAALALPLASGCAVLGRSSIGHVAAAALDHLALEAA